MSTTILACDLFCGSGGTRFRMLQPKELAAAMSFPADYHFTGNREDQVKQIGNSVAVGVAKALCLSILNGQFTTSGR